MQESPLLEVVPVLAGVDLDRDIKWYRDHSGFELVRNDVEYAILKRDKIFLHLQWHADTEGYPLPGGSVVRIFLEDKDVCLDEFYERKTVKPEKLKRNTDWGTHEFGFYDSNRNAIFIVQDI